MTTRLALCALFLALSTVAPAQEFRRLPPPPPLTIEHGWLHFERGAWVDVRIRRKEGDTTLERTERRKLKETGKDGTATIEIQDSPAAAPTVRTVQHEICPTDRFKNETPESCDIGGSESHCMVQANARAGIPSATEDEVRIWIAWYVPVPGWVVRIHRRKADGTTLLREVVEFNRFVEFGGRKVMCTVWKETESSPGGGTIETVELESPDVPGGVVSRKSKGEIARNGAKVAVEAEEVATAFREDAGSADDAERRSCDDARALIRFQPSAWLGFGAGSYSEHRSETYRAEETSVQIARTKVLKQKPGGTTMEFHHIAGWHKKGAPGDHRHEPTSHDLASNGCYLRTVRVKREGEATLEVDGKAWPCRVFLTEAIHGVDPSSTCTIPGVLSRRIWVCPDFPANRGILKMEFGRGTVGGATVITERETVTGLDREFRLGGKVIRCHVVKGVQDEDRENGLGETESWQSPEVPGRGVRFQRWEGSGKNRVLKVLMELTAIEVFKK